MPMYKLCMSKFRLPMTMTKLRMSLSWLHMPMCKLCMSKIRLPMTMSKVRVSLRILHITMSKLKIRIGMFDLHMCEEKLCHIAARLYGYYRKTTGSVLSWIYLLITNIALRLHFIGIPMWMKYQLVWPINGFETIAFFLWRLSTALFLCPTVYCMRTNNQDPLFKTNNVVS